MIKPWLLLTESLKINGEHIIEKNYCNSRQKVVRAIQEVKNSSEIKRMEELPLVGIFKKYLHEGSSVWNKFWKISRILQNVSGHGGIPNGGDSMSKGIETKYSHVQKTVKNPDWLEKEWLEEFQRSSRKAVVAILWKALNS